MLGSQGLRSNFTLLIQLAEDYMGNPVHNMPSRFLKEIPRDLLDDLSPSGFSTTFNRANTISRAESEIRPSGRNLATTTQKKIQ